MRWNIQLDKTYKLVFESAYSALDGVYKAVEVTTWDELISQGVNLMDSFYSKAGLSNDDLQADLTNTNALDTPLTQDTFVKFTTPDGCVTEMSYTWVPLSKLKMYPDSSVSNYKKLILTANLGVIDDPDTLTVVRDILNMELETRVGIQNCVQIAAYANVWLTEYELNTINSARDSIKTETTNVWSQNVELTNAITKLQSEKAALEEIIRNLTQ
jgi:hypothetical protein